MASKPGTNAGNGNAGVKVTLRGANVSVEAADARFVARFGRP